MKLTTARLKRLIKEELEAVMQEGAEESDESIDLKLHALGQFMFHPDRFADEQKKLKNLYFFLGRDQSNPENRNQVDSWLEQIPGHMKSRHDLKDSRIVSELINTYRMIESNPQDFYAHYHDQITALMPQGGKHIHKKAKEMFGDTELAARQGGVQRTWLQKAGSFLTGKGFKE